MNRRPTGNSKARALRDLAKHAPELLIEVEAGRLSANAAMVKAGLRRAPILISLGSDEAKLAQDIFERLDAERFARFARCVRKLAASSELPPAPSPARVVREASKVEPIALIRERIAVALRAGGSRGTVARALRVSLTLVENVAKTLG